MNFRICGHFFFNVRVPLLWGSRAVLRDAHGHLSIVDISGGSPTIEVVDDRPAADGQVLRTRDGFVILDREGNQLYSLNVETKSLVPIALRLPTVTFGERDLSLGPNVFALNMVGVEIGIVVSEDGLELGGPLP